MLSNIHDKSIFQSNIHFEHLYRSARSNTDVKVEMERASKKYVVLANSQYINGVISYMDVLDAQRKYLASQLELSEARTKENLSVVNLYKALGGGWKDF